MSQSGGERLQKVLARAGIGSRRACDELIGAGRVSVNGHRAELGLRVDTATDVIEIDGVRIAVGMDLVYLALHKPIGVLTTARDTHERSTVFDLVPDEPRVFSVGRLDKDTSGLLLLTNDGEFANRVAHPRFGVPKTYVAEIRGGVNRAHVKKLVRGVDLPDGPATAEDVRIRATSGQRTLLEVVVHEGRNRLVRRMLAEVGLEVVSLTRTAIGEVRLGKLPVGKWRRLKQTEVLELLREANT